MDQHKTVRMSAIGMSTSPRTARTSRSNRTARTVTTSRAKATRTIEKRRGRSPIGIQGISSIRSLIANERKVGRAISKRASTNGFSLRRIRIVRETIALASDRSATGSLDTAPGRKARGRFHI